MSEMLRKEIPLLLAVFLSVFFLFDYYVYADITRSLASSLKEWAVIIATISMGLGVISLVSSSSSKIRKRDPYWYMEIWMFVVIILVSAFGLFSPGSYGQHPWFLWTVNNVYLPIDATIVGMVMLEIVSVFYRAFRIRTKESIILFVVTIIIMLSQVQAIGAFTPIFLNFGNWIMDVPSNAGSRGLLIAAAIGLVGFLIRFMFGYERATIGVTE